MGVSTHLWAWRSYLIFLLTPFIFAPLPLAVQSPESRCAYVILIMAVYWISECLPVGITSLLPVVFFPFFEILSSDQISKAYMNNINMLFLGGLMVAIAIEYWNIHKRIALRVLTLVGSEPRWIMLGMMISTWFLSMWISNTATTAMMVPITEAILEELRESTRDDDADLKSVKLQSATCSNEDSQPEEHQQNGQELKPVNQNSENSMNHQDGPQDRKSSDEEDPHFREMAKGMLLSICYAANCGGIASLTGTGPNLVLKQQVDKLFESNGLKTPVTFGVWMTFGLPLSAVMLLVSWCWLHVLFLRCRGICSCCARTSSDEQERKSRVARMVREQYNALGPLVCGQVLVGLLFVSMVILWITRDMGGVAGWGGEFNPPVKDGTSAILVCILIFAFPSTLPFLKSYPNSSHPETDPSYGQIKADVRPAQNSKIAIRPLLNWKFAAQRFPWALVLLLGGGFSISDGCKASGLSPWIGNELTYFKDWNEYAILFIICYISTASTEFASNTAMTSIMMPILQRLALSTQVHPLKYMLPACLACSFAYMLPVATPPNAIVFSSGRLKITDMMKAGVGMNLISVPILVGMIVSLGNVVYEMDHIPPEFLNMTSSPVVISH